MGYNGISSGVCFGFRSQMQYHGEQQPRAKARNGSSSTKLTEIPSSGEFCFKCNIMIPRGDDEIVYNTEGKKGHKICPRR